MGASAGRRRGPIGGLVLDSELKERLAVRMAISAILRAVDTVNKELGGDITLALVFAAVLEANIGHLSRTPEAAAGLEGMDRVPPDSMRRPVTGVALAATLGIPNETVRRKVKTLIAQGLLARVEGGLIVPTQVMAGEQMTRICRASFLNLRRLYIHLKRIGVSLEDDGSDLEALPA